MLFISALDYLFFYFLSVLDNFYINKIEFITGIFDDFSQCGLNAFDIKEDKYIRFFMFLNFLLKFRLNLETIK